jgi:hypothetical protein
MASLTDLAGRLEEYAASFGEFSTTREYSELAEGLAELAEQCGQSWERWQGTGGFLELAATHLKETHPMAEKWNYQILGPESAGSDNADIWLVMGEKGDHRRCFGGCPSRAEAERLVDYVRNWHNQPRQEEPKREEGYYTSQDRNGTEDEITIHAPDGRELAYIWFWEAEADQPGAGDQEAKADAQHIVAALNAYRPGSPPGQDADTKPYYAGIVPKAIFEQADALYIHAPDGRGMAFIDLPDRYGRTEAQLQIEFTKMMRGFFHRFGRSIRSSCNAGLKPLRYRSEPMAHSRSAIRSA